jgi:hypothetical protein
VQFTTPTFHCFYVQLNCIWGPLDWITYVCVCVCNYCYIVHTGTSLFKIFVVYQIYIVHTGASLLICAISIGCIILMVLGWRSMVADTKMSWAFSAWQAFVDARHAQQRKTQRAMAFAQRNCLRRYIFHYNVMLLTR